MPLGIRRKSIEPSFRVAVPATAGSSRTCNFLKRARYTEPTRLSIIDVTRLRLFAAIFTRRLVAIVSKASKGLRRKRRKTACASLLGLLSSYRLSSLLPLIDAASVSPTAAHRNASLGRLFVEAVRLGPRGDHDATFADLPKLVDAARERSPELIMLEDWVPLDPRLDVRIEWNDGIYRILPGNLERPVAMFERARIVHRVTAPALLKHLGFSIDDVAQLILTRLDQAANSYDLAWLKEEQQPTPWDPPRISEEELEAGKRLQAVRNLVPDSAESPGLSRALTWATRPLNSLEFNAHDGSSMFGPTVAVQTAEQVIALSSGFWPDSFESSVIELAHLACVFDDSCLDEFRAESERALRSLFRMWPLAFEGPFTDRDGTSNVFALLVDERNAVLFDLVTILDMHDPAIAGTIRARHERLMKISAGDRLKGPSGRLLIRDETHLARVLLLSTPGHAVVPGQPGVAGASLDDLRWIVAHSREAPDDIFFFFDEVANSGQELIAFETINVFEHWRANGKCLSREGAAWDVISIEPHRGDREWIETAKLSPLIQAMHSMELPPLYTWDGYDRHSRWPTCSFGKFPNGPYWDLRFVPPLVAIQCFDPTSPREARGTLTNMASGIHWRIERSPELQALLLSLELPRGLRIVFVPSHANGNAWLRVAEANKTELLIAWEQDLAEHISQNDAAAEGLIGEVLASGILAVAAANGLQFDSAAFITAWNAAPPGLRSTAIRVPVSATKELPDPIPISGALVSSVRHDLARRLKEEGTQPGRYDAQAATRLESDKIAPTLQTMLANAIAPFNRESLIPIALVELERSLSAKWFEEQKRRQNEGFPVLAYDPVEREVSEGHEAHRLTRVISLLAEEAIAVDSGGTGKISRMEWMRLLAISEVLMESYLRSESNHYGLVPAVTVIDSMFAVNQERTANPPLLDQKAFAAGRAQFKIASAASPALAKQIRDEEKAILARISDGVLETVGFRLETFVTVLDIGRTWDVPAGDDIAEITIDQFRARCADLAPEQDVDEAIVALKYLTLRPEQLVGEIEHWEQERRRVRLMTRPFVQKTGGSVYVLPWQCEGSRRVTGGYLHQGRLIWLDKEPSPKLKAALDDLREYRNKSLELEAEQVARRVTPFVRRNIDKARVIGLDERIWAGEIDCIAVDATRNVVHAIDAKDAYLAFSPATIARSIQRFNGPDQYVDKLLKKVTAVSSDPNAVAAALGVPDLPRRWDVEPLMVTRYVEPAAFARGQRVRFCTIAELENVLSDSI